MPRFYPNVVTLQPGKAALAEQRDTIDILLKSNLPGRWSVKDSFRALDLSRRGFELLLEARWIRNTMPTADVPSDIVWQRETKGAAGLPFDDPDFAMFTGRRGFQVVAGGMFYRAGGVVGLTNVVADARDAPAVSRAGTSGGPDFPATGFSGLRVRRRAEGRPRGRLRDRRQTPHLGQVEGLKPQACSAVSMCGGGGAVTTTGGLFFDSASTMARECRCRCWPGSALP